MKSINQSIIFIVFILILIGNILSAQYIQNGNKIVENGLIEFGTCAEISSDGKTAIIGAKKNGAFIFRLNGNSWIEEAHILGTGSIGEALQGSSVSISADGNTVIIGGYGDNYGIGAAWIFSRNGTSWSQQGEKLVGTGNIGESSQGVSVSISSDATVAFIGGPNDNSGIGAVWAFVRSGNTWSQQGQKIVGIGNSGPPNQGYSVSLDATGSTAVVGGYGDKGNIGAAWIFVPTGTIWSQQGEKLVGTGNVGQAYQGGSVSLSANGNTALMGGYDDSTGVGAAWIFNRQGTSWLQQGEKLVGRGSKGKARQGISISISDDGNTAILGGCYDNDSNNFSVGATWIFQRVGTTWLQQGTKLVGNKYVGQSLQGNSVSVSGDGNTVIISGNGDNNKGAAWIFNRLPNLIGNNAIAVPSIIPPGDSLSIAYQIKNIGKYNSHSCFLHYVLSKDSIYDGTDIAFSGNVPIQDLSPGAVVDMNGKYKISDTVVLGGYYVLLVLDINNDKMKFNQANKLAYIPILISNILVSKSNVVVSDFVVRPDSLYSGDAITVSGVVKNFGQADSKSCNYQYFLSTDQLLDSNDIEASGLFPLRPINPDSVVRINSSQIQISSNIPVGTYYMYLNLIGCNGKNSPADNKNFPTKIVKILPFPDLTITSALLSPKAVYQGDSISISCILQNTGNGKITSESKLQYFISNDSVFDPSDLELRNNFSTSALLTSQSLQIPISKYKIPANYKIGNYYILLYSDKDNLIRESNKLNNFVALPFMINPRSVITGINLAASTPVGSAATLKIKVNSNFPLKSVLFSYTRITDYNSKKDSMLLTKNNFKDSIFNVNIPANIFDEIGVEYTFFAIDSLSNVSLSLSGAIHVYWPEPGIVIPYNAFGPSVSNYRTIAVPLELDNKSIPSVLGKTLGDYDRKRWRFFKYINGSNIEYGNGVNNIETGKGYWLVIKDDRIHPMNPYFIVRLKALILFNETARQ